MNIKTKTKMKDILQYALVLLILLASETIWEKMPDKQARDAFSIFAYGGTATVLFILIFFGKAEIQRKKFSRFLLCFLYFFGLVAINLIVYKASIALMFAVPTVLLLYYFLIYDNEIKNVMDKFYNIVVAIAFLSLLVYVLYVLLGVIDAPTTFPFLRNNWTQNAPSFYVLFYPQGERNCAFFYEAPKYNLVLTLALAYSCYVNKNFVTKKNVLLLLSILSAQSATGILLALAILVTKLIFKTDMYKVKKNLIVLFSPIIFTVAALVFFQVLSDKLNSASGAERLLDYRIGLYAWMMNPLFGSGLGNNSTIDLVAYQLGRSGFGFSSGVFRILAQGGVYFMLFLVVPLCRFFAMGTRQKKPYMIFLGFLFLGLIFITSFPTTMVYSLFMAFFASYSET